MTPADGEQPGEAAVGEVKDPPASAAAALNEAPWYGALPETNDDEKGFKQWVENKKFSDPIVALKAQRDLEKHVGANRVALPKDGDDFTQWEGHDKLGIPKEAKDYKIDRPQLPEGMTWDEGFENTVKDAAAKLRIHPTQLKGLVDVYSQAQIAQHNSLKEHQAEEAGKLQELFKEWGAEKGQNVDFAKRGAKFLGWTDEEVAAVESVEGGRKLMTALNKLGRKVKEGSSVDGDGSPVIGVEAAKAAIQRFNDRIAKGETLTKEEMAQRSSLYKQVHG